MPHAHGRPDSGHDTVPFYAATDTTTGVSNHELSDPQVRTDGTADQRTHDINDTRTVDDSSAELLAFATTAPQDYLTDDEFGDMYRYLESDELTGNERKDRTILLTAERYLIDRRGWPPIYHDRKSLHV